MNKLIGTILVLFLVQPCVVNSDVLDSKGRLNNIHLESQPYQNSVIYRFKPDTYLSFENFSGNSKDNYGLKFVILQHVNGAYRTLYESQGSGDSYILKPTFYSVDPTKEPILILAEVGAEYSWGIRVFLLNQNLEVKDLGLLDVAVEPDTEFTDGPESAIPFTHVAEDNGRYSFTFKKDVIYDPGGLNDKKVQKEEISYYYDGDALKLTMSSD